MKAVHEVREEITRVAPCECGGERQVKYIHVLRNGQLHLYVSSECLSCGSAHEADFDRLPSDVRDAFIREQGKWALAVEKRLFTKARALLRTDLALSLSEVLRARGEHGFLHEGTRVEMAFLAQRLAQHGIGAEVVQIAAPTASKDI